jgi:hypothetical protein
VERACYANIGLAVGDQWLTHLEDRMANTVSNHLRGCVYQLATWFAANWWRLRWEPDTRDWSTNVDWRMSHSMASAGGGFVWPNVLFASDGDYLAVASRPMVTAAAFEPIHYLHSFDGRIAAVEFENKVDAFIESVISRLHALGIEADGLPGLWAEVVAERNNPRIAQCRKLEAMAGYDPDESPEGLIAKLLEDQKALGISAIEEVAADARHSVDEALKPMREVSRSRKPKEGGCRMNIPHLSDAITGEANLPWQSAGALAARARKEWNLGNKPLLNKRLADLLGTTTNVFADDPDLRTRTPFAVRKGHNGTVDVYLHSRIPANRRFALSRLIGDHLYFKNGEKLIPATHAGTVRQKFQRAFAQELLCPHAALLEKMQTDHPDQDDIVEAAKYFHVSDWVVTSTLVNKGQLDRSSLADAQDLAAIA